MAEKNVTKLRAEIRHDLAQLNYDLNLVVGKFFSKLQTSLHKYDKYIGSDNALIPGIDNFQVVIDLTEELYPEDQAFTGNMGYRGQQVVIIRHCCYLIGTELGLSYSHMVRVLNDMHSSKVVHHATMLHGANKIRVGLDIKDKRILPIWSSLMNRLQEKGITKTFVSLDSYSS